jgi:hypothetical protein
MKLAYSTPLLLLLTTATACHKDGIKPKQLQGNWTAITTSFFSREPDGTEHSGQRLSLTSMEITKTEVIHRFLNSPTMTYRYERKDKRLTLYSPTASAEDEMEIRELTDSKLVTHLEHRTPTGYFYAEDTEFQR